MTATVGAERTSVFPRFLDLAYPNIERGLVTLSTMPTRDGFAGDQTLFAPPFTSTEDELDEMVERFAGAVRQVANEVEARLAAVAVS